MWFGVSTAFILLAIVLYFIAFVNTDYNTGNAASWVKFVLAGFVTSFVFSLLSLVYAIILLI